MTGQTTSQSRSTSPLLTPYQRRWLRDRGRRKLLVKSRRIGGSFVVALECALGSAGFTRARNHAPLEYRPERGTTQRIVSASHAQSKELLEQAGQHLEVIGRELVGKDLIAKRSVERIELINGARLHALAPNPRTVRGGEGDVTLDEFGAMPQADKVWAAAKSITDPTLRRPYGYKLRVVGTPLGDDNMFYRLAETDAGKAFHRHRVDINLAVSEGFPANIEELRAEAGDEDMFAQEYLCVFLSARDRYISAELFDACTFAPHEAPSGAVQCTRFGGMDVARKPTGDLSAINELRKISDRLWFDRRDEKRGASWETQRAWVDGVMQRVNMLAIDATGLGSQFAEELQQAYGSRVEPVEFTPKNKELLATGLRKAMESGKIRLPAEDPELRRDVLSIRREITSHGNVRYDAPRSKEGHADRAWALMLAVHAGNYPAPSVDVTTTGNERVSAGLRRARGVGSRIRGR